MGARGIPWLAAAIALAGCGRDEGANAPNDAAADAANEAADTDAGTDASANDADADVDTRSRPECPAGAVLVSDRTSCPGAPLSVPPAFAAAASSGSRGAVVSMAGLDPASAPCAPALVCIPADAPTMLFSDEPEAPSTDGILYADSVAAGRYRVYVYHANGGASPRRFTVAILNPGSADAHAIVGPKGIAGPSTRYVATGKSAAEAWLRSSPGATLVIPAGARVVLDASLDALVAQKDELIHAIIDLTVDAPVKISVVSLLAGEDTVTTTAGLPLLPNSGRHTRGTFPSADRIVVSARPLDGEGVRRLELGGNVTEPDLEGTDAVDGLARVTLGGNYGVVYGLVLDTSAKTAFAIAPRGGAWGGAADIAAGDDGDAGVLLLPSSAESLGTTTDAILAGRFGARASLRLISAGGSSLPVDFLSVPLP